MSKSIKISFFLAAALIALAANSLYRNSDVVEMEYKRTKFGKLTSKVWRYGSEFSYEDLQPVANNNPTAEKQPKRDRPTRITLDTAQNKAYITLQGTEEIPGNEVAVFDISQKKIVKKIRLEWNSSC